MRRRAAIWILATAWAGTATAAVFHVDAAAPGRTVDGQSWQTAFLSLEDALERARFFDEIRVAGGVYVPSTDGLDDSRDATFLIPDGIRLAGGFAGARFKNPEARDPVRYRTVLSGDLQGDDVAGSTSDNCRNVLTALLVGSNTVIEGFVIRGGNSDAVFAPPFFPAGLPGGGMFASGSPKILDCVFEKNTALAGGALFNFEGSISLTRCVFRHNRAERGGAMVLFGTDDPSSVSGGFVAHGFPSVRACTFERNTSTEIGGAVWVDGIAENPTFTHCRFRKNRAGTDGGAMWSGGGITDLNNCLLESNVAGRDGGAVYADTLVTIRHSTLFGNKAERGGGVFAFFLRPSIRDSIFWRNVGEDGGERAQIYDGNAAPLIEYSCVEGWSGDWRGAGNFGADPMFVPGPDGCYYLQADRVPASPCVDAGSDSAMRLDVSALTTRVDEGLDADTADIGFHHPVTGRRRAQFDADVDGRIDLRDYAGMSACFGEGELSPCCRVFDGGGDDRVDLADVPGMICRMRRFAPQVFGPPLGPVENGRLTRICKSLDIR